MEDRTDILVVGGGPAGLVCASTARQYYPSKSVTVLKDVEKGVVPCGIPYMFSSLNSPVENELNTRALEDQGVRVTIGRADKLDRGKKAVITGDGNVIRYEKLVLSVGSEPIVPGIPGMDKQGVYPIHKNMDYLKKAVKRIKGGGNILIIGGGFIGVEFADELAGTPGSDVFLVEMLPGILANSFDTEFSVLAAEKLKARGVNVITGTSVRELAGGEKVKEAVLSDGRRIPVDTVILGIGAVPRTTLAVEADLDLDRGGGIWVDEYMRTSDRDIYAVGDCAGKKDFYTRRHAPVMLASTATAEARIAGANLYSVKVVRENKGTIAIYSTYVDGLVLGSAGLTERSAKSEGFEIEIGTAETMDKHPSAMPDVNKLRVKLIFSRQSGIIMGGQVAGGVSAGEIINIIGMAIQQRVSLCELETLQMATHPCLTSAPTKYPVVLAAQNARNR